MENVKIYHRDDCRVCGSEDLKRWVHLPQMPLTDDLRKPENKQDGFLYDIDVYYCNNCRASQTLKIIDLSDYYLDYMYTVAESKLANNFMKRLAESTFNTYRLSKGSIVLEVGSGDGLQLSYFKKLGAKVMGFEPSAELCRRSESIDVPVYQGLFTEESIHNIPSEYTNADVLLLTYTFDHIPEPVKFLEAAQKIINPDSGLLIMEVHDLEKIVKRREYCLFEHEHFIYLSARTMQEVLKRCGFELISIDLLPESERRGNSLLVVATPIKSIHSLSVEKKYSEEHINYDTFNDEMLQGIKRLDAFVESHVAAGRKVAGYGAGGRGVMTLAAMNSADKLSYVCDNNTDFHGYITPKSGVPIFSPNQLSNDPVDVLLVFSFGYFNEIKEAVSKMANAPSNIVSMLDIL